MGTESNLLSEILSEIEKEEETLRLQWSKRGLLKYLPKMLVRKFKPFPVCLYLRVVVLRDDFEE